MVQSLSGQQQPERSDSSPVWHQRDGDVATSTDRFVQCMFLWVKAMWLSPSTSHTRRHVFVSWLPNPTAVPLLLANAGMTGWKYTNHCQALYIADR